MNLGQYDLLPATQAVIERMYARDEPQDVRVAETCEQGVLELWDEVFPVSDKREDKAA